MSSKDIDITLVDYFAVAGYDPETGLVVDQSCESYSPQYSPGTQPESQPPLQRSFVANIIHHFPQRRPAFSFPTEILPLCMPKGLRFYTEKDVPSQPTIHSFANIRADGSRISGTALTFYEEVKDVAICEAMSQLHQEHVRELTAISNSVAGESHQRAHLPPGTVSGGTHTLPRGRKNRSKRISYYDGGDHNLLYMSRTLCIITRLPLVNASKSLLMALYRLLTSKSSPNLPLESYIYWCLYEVPMPMPGMTLKVPFLDTTIVVQHPGIKELPFFDDSIGSIFEFLPIERFIRLFSCFLLEHQILLCSKDLSRLMSVCESLLVLAFPFRWQMTYSPVLPYSRLGFIESPVPYVMGYCYEEMVPESIFHSNVCIVDLDSGRAELPEDVPIFPGAKQLANEIRNALQRLALMRPTNVSACSEKTESVLEGGVRLKNKKVSRRNEDWAMKRMSRSFDLDDGNMMNEEMHRPSRAGLQELPLKNVLQNNETVARVAEIARRAGVIVDVDNIEAEMEQNLNSPIAQNYFAEAKINNAIRECVLNRFAEMFYSYEHFVIGGQGCEDRETYEENRESMVSFDKASFLSDQPDSHLNFLAAFLETQMFTSFIDAKILAQWETPDEAVVLFDSRIAAMHELLGVSIVRTPTYETTPAFAVTEELIAKREENADYVVPPPHALAGAFAIRYDGVWPMYQLNTSLLDGANLMSPAPSPWRQRYQRLRSNTGNASPNGNTTSARPTSVYGGAGLMQVESSKQIAQQQYAFVQQLLKETKGKTKRMLVDKMGKEAVHLGHLDAGITGVEENTLVASFCDLLERIFAHGLKNKHGKSALWNFILQHQDFEKPGLTARAASTSMLTPDFTNPAWSGSQTDVSNIGGYASVEGSPRKMRSHSITRSQDGERVMVPPLPKDVAYDFQNVLHRTEIKTDIGYARAFVRLALERKLLHKHLAELLSNNRVIRELYKPYAFVASEEEREQFLYHILSLNAAQFRCFTNNFTKTRMRYQLVIITGPWRGTLPAIWVKVEGTLCSSHTIHVEPNMHLFKFDVEKNLGILSTLRIGYQPSEKTGKWFVDYIFIRNQITGQNYKFPCGRWFGEDSWFGGNESSTLERLLIAEPFVEIDRAEQQTGAEGVPFSPARRMTSRSQTPQRERSPSSGRMSEHNSRKTRINDVQHLLGESVNALVKYFYSGRKVKSELAHLLCGQKGLVMSIEAAFQIGRQESIIKFFRNICPWDYIDRVCAQRFRRKEIEKISTERHSIILYALRLHQKINSKQSLGKDGKFHVFILLSIRDHTLPGILLEMSMTPVTAEMYNEPSFLRTSAHLSYLTKLLNSLSEFNITIDPSLTYGIV